MKEPPVDLGIELLAHTDLILRSEPVARFDEVAAAVGRSRAALYYYFAGRDDLVAFVLRAHVEAGASAIAAGDPGEATPAVERLRSMLGAVLDHLGQRPQVCSGLLAASGAGGAMAEVLEWNDRLIARPFRAVIESGRRDGSLSAGPPDVAVDVVLGAVLLAVLGRWSRGGDAAHEVFRRSVVDQIVGGLAAHD